MIYLNVYSLEIALQISKELEYITCVFKTEESVLQALQKGEIVTTIVFDNNESLESYVLSNEVDGCIRQLGENGFDYMPYKIYSLEDIKEVKKYM